MVSTGKFDRNNQEIFLGDKVIKAWGYFSLKGKGKTYYQIHTITLGDAHLMANGEMHDDGGGKIFCLGSACNRWGNKEVQKLTESELKEIEMPDDTLFFFDENKKAIKMTDQHMFEMSDEQWQKELERINLKLFRGK